MSFISTILCCPATLTTTKRSEVDDEGWEDCGLVFRPGDLISFTGDLVFMEGGGLVGLPYGYSQKPQFDPEERCLKYYKKEPRYWGW